MDLQDQLKRLFPDHVPEVSNDTPSDHEDGVWLQEAPILCKYEKRKGKPITILDGYTGSNEDFKTLTKMLKTSLNVGGSYKNDKIFIQGNYRDKIMAILKAQGFNVKRVGG